MSKKFAAFYLTGITLSISFINSFKTGSMNPYLINVVLQGKNKQSENDETKTYSNYELAKNFRQFKVRIKRLLVDIFLIALGVLSAGFGLKGFLLPNNFIDGGAVGISLLLAEVSGISLSILLVVVNIPFIVLGYWSIGKEFAIKTATAIIVLAIVVAVLPYPQITTDKLLVSVFGGFFLGSGIGLAVRGGGVIDGTEVLAINISRKLALVDRRHCLNPQHHHFFLCRLVAFCGNCALLNPYLPGCFQDGRLYY
jgi:hypothetical protein